MLGVLTRRTLGRGRAVSVIAVTALAALLSVAVEVLQLHTVDRIASAIDVGAGMAGAAIGALAAGRAVAWGGRLLDAIRPSGVLDARERPILLALLAAIAVWAWFPFDPTLDVTTMVARVRAVSRDPWQMASGSFVVEAGLYALLTGVTARCLIWLKPGPAAAIAVAATIAAAILIDAGQVAMGARPIGLAGLAAQLAGALCGAAAFTIRRGRE